MEAASKAAQILAQMIGKLQKYGCWKRERKKSGYRGTTLRILATNVHHKLASNRQQSGK